MRRSSPISAWSRPLPRSSGGRVSDRAADHSERRSRRFSPMIETLLRWLSPVIFLLAWEWAVNRGVLDHHFFPAPSSMLAIAWQDIVSGDMLRNALGSLERLAGGLLIGSV